METDQLRTDEAWSIPGGSMAAPEAGAKVAKDLGIYLSQIYSYIKKGTVKNHLEGGYPTGKGIKVDPDEVKAAMSTSRRKGGGPGKGKSGYVRKADRAARNDDTRPEPVKARRLTTGTIVSYETGKQLNGSKIGPPQYTVAQVVGATNNLTYLDNGEHRRHYSGTVIGNYFLGTDQLSVMLAKGVARVERPTHILGMIILAFIVEGKVDLATSLEKWMEKNDLEVHIPEIVDTEPDDDEPEPVRRLPTAIASDEDDDDA